MTQDDIISVFASHYSPVEIEVISSWSQDDLYTAIDEAWSRRQDRTDYKQFSKAPQMSSDGTLTITFNPKLKLPSYTKTLDERRALQQEDAQSSKALIDFLNSEYGQLHDYADYACEDGSGEDCVQVSVD